MVGLDIWDILGIAAIICLVLTFFSIGRKPIWGALVCGLVIAAAITVITLTLNGELIKRILTVCVLIGCCFWLLDLSSIKPKKKKL